MNIKLLAILFFSILCTNIIAQDLFFSEYIEGSGNNRAIEIYNGTGATVDLSTYTIKQSHSGIGFDNDPVAAAYVLPLSGNLADGDVYVIVNNGADSTILAAGDMGFSYADTAGARIPFFTGDDALALYNNGVLIDIIGIASPDPGSGWDVAGVEAGTANHTLIRKNSVTTEIGRASCRERV